MKIGDPLSLGTIQIRQAMGRARGFKTISEEPAINLISDPTVLQILNALVDMSGGILWGCWEQKLFTKLHPPVLIHKYSSALDQIKADRMQEDGMLVRISHLEMENERLIKELHTEREEREAASCDSDDAQEKIRKMQDVIDKYEGLAMDI
ncbi:unnamed protein product [marine sediment metagenome]|uniref:Uncharacterized protein n=1 Tax=marine sediment metagenome TaxID=412755 RepID=X1J9W1_9ZZZZ